MALAMEKVVDEALLLPADERMGLVEKLLASLNLPTRPDIDRLWAEEAERRVHEVEQGNVDMVPGDAVFEKIRKKYGR